MKLFKDVLDFFGPQFFGDPADQSDLAMAFDEPSGPPEGAAGMLFSHFLPKLALLLETDLAGEKVLQQGGRAAWHLVRK